MEKKANSKHFIIFIFCFLILTTFVLALLPNVETPVFNVTTVTKTSGIKANSTYSPTAGSATIYWRWFRNNTEVFTENQTSIPANTIINSTLNNTFYNRSDLLNTTVQADDGLTNSSINFSTTLTVANTLPTHGTPILNSTLGTNLTTENITVYNVSTNDPDIDAVKNIYNWYRNNTPIIVLNLPFEGGSNATNTTDYSGFNNNGLPKTGTTWNATGGFDGKGAYYFNATATLNITWNTALNTSGPFTVMFWARPQGAINNNMVPVCKGANNAEYLFIFNNQFFFRVADPASSLYTAQGTTTPSLNIWTHVAGRYNGTNVSVFVNGVLEKTVGGPTSVKIATTAIHIGSCQGSSNFWNGTIDEVQIYNTSLTDAQIKAIYNNRTDTIVGSGLLNETNLHKGDLWNASVTPNDGNGDGTAKFTTALTIANTAPTIETPVFNVTTVTKTSGIRANTTYRDVDSDGGNVSFTWYRNNSVVFTENFTAQAAATIITSNLSVNFYNRTDLINVTVIANDGTANSSLNFSTTLAVANTVPTQGTPILNSSRNGNNTDENITIFNVSTADVDADGIKNIFNWYRNNTPVLLLNMPFEGGSNATTTNDFSSFGNNGAVNNSMFWNATGGFDGKGAYYFNGSATPNQQKYITLANASYFNISSNFSVELWFRKQGKGIIGVDGLEFIIDKGKIWAMTMNDSLSRLNIVFNVTQTFNSSLVIQNNTWYHTVLVINDSNYSLYLNGVLDSSAGRQAFTINTRNITIGALEANGGGAISFFNGSVDDVRIWNRTLTAVQVKALYNNLSNTIVSQELVQGDQWKAEVTPNDGNNSGAVSTSSAVTVNGLNIILFTPENGSRRNSINQAFTFNVTGGALTICNLFDNDTGTYRNVTSISTIAQNGNNSLTHTAILENNTIVWNVECISPEGSRFFALSNFSLSVDRTLPIITFNRPIRANTTAYLTQNVTLNLTCDDTGAVNQFLANVTNSTNQSIYQNLTTNLPGTQFNLTPSINFSNNATGLYKLNVQCSDDHTKIAIKNYNYTTDKQNMMTSFETDEGTNITIQAIYSDLNLKNIFVEKQIDRYSFTFDWKPKTPPYNMLYQVISSQRLDYRNGSKYKGHFVTKNNWIDFDGFDSNVTVFQNDTGWYVNLTTDTAYQNFSSVGGLNIVEENVSFSYGFINGTYVHPQTPSNASFVKDIQTINVTGEHVANNITSIIIYVDGTNRTQCSNQNWCNLTLNVSSNLSIGVHGFNATVIGGISDTNITVLRNFSTSENYTINDTIMGTQFGYEISYTSGTVPTDEPYTNRFKHISTINITNDAIQNLTIYYVFNTSRLEQFPLREFGGETMKINGSSDNITFIINSDNVTVRTNRSLSQGIYTFEFSYYYNTKAAGGTGGSGGGGLLIPITIPPIISSENLTYQINGENLTKEEVEKKGVLIEKNNKTIIILGLENQYLVGNSILFKIYSFDKYVPVNVNLIYSQLDDNNDITKQVFVVNKINDTIGIYEVNDTVKNINEGLYSLLTGAQFPDGEVIISEYDVKIKKKTLINEILQYLGKIPPLLWGLIILFFIIIILIIILYKSNN